MRQLSERITKAHALLNQEQASIQSAKQRLAAEVRLWVCAVGERDRWRPQNPG